MDINKLAKSIHLNAVRKGFWNGRGNEGEKLMLVITELAEMLEADRKKKYNPNCIQLFQVDMARASKFRYSKKQKLGIKRDLFEKHIKDSLGDELADAFIRMLDYCIGFNVVVEKSAIQALADNMKSEKIGNLGETLLNLCGTIKILHMGVEKKSSAQAIMASMMWIADELNIPLEAHIRLKAWYNSTRPKMHGKKY